HGLRADEVIAQNQPHVQCAHDQMKNGLDYLSRTNAERQPFKDAARRTTITTNEAAGADHKRSPDATSPQSTPSRQRQPAPTPENRPSPPPPPPRKKPSPPLPSPTPATPAAPPPHRVPPTLAPPLPNRVPGHNHNVVPASDERSRGQALSKAT